MEHNRTFRVNGANNYILVKSSNPVTEEHIYIIEVAYKYIANEYEKLTYILNEDNKILEAKYNAIEALQKDLEDLPDSKKYVDIVSQYIINLEVLKDVKFG